MSQPSATLVEKILIASFAPVTKIFDAYATLPLAQYISLPSMLLTAFLLAMMTWMISRFRDDEPYLFNGGKLGELEKKSIFVKKEK